jgi:uncharacterized protein YuzB (UPF0349 family)
MQPHDSSSSEVDSNDMENCYNNNYDFFGENSKKYMSNNPSMNRISLDNCSKFGMILDSKFPIVNQQIISGDSSFANRFEKNLN